VDANLEREREREREKEITSSSRYRSGPALTSAFLCESSFSRYWICPLLSGTSPLKRNAKLYAAFARRIVALTIDDKTVMCVLARGLALLKFKMSAIGHVMWDTCGIERNRRYRW